MQAIVHKLKEKRVIMDQEQYLTDYDTLIQSRELQMLKAMLPFANPKAQMPIAMFIQSLEFRNTLRMFQTDNNLLTACSVSNDSDRKNAMLQTLRRFCTPKERETIDTLLNIMCVMENYDTFQK